MLMGQGDPRLFGSTASLSLVTFSHGTNIRLFSLLGVTTVGAGGGVGPGWMGWEETMVGISGRTAGGMREDRVHPGLRGKGCEAGARQV